MKKCLLAFALAVLILLSATAFGVMFLHTNDTLYKADVRLLGLAWRTGMDENEIMDNYNAMMEYLTPFHKGDFDLPTMTFSENGAYQYGVFEYESVEDKPHIQLTRPKLIATFSHEWRAIRFMDEKRKEEMNEKGC